MGFFSGKVRTQISSTAQRMTTDAEFKYSSQHALSQYLWETSGKLSIDLDTSLSEYYIQAHQQSLVSQWKKAYYFAKKPNRYHFGLPTSSVVLDIEEQADKAIKTYLNLSDEEILFSDMTDIDYYYAIWDSLLKTYHYNSKDNTLLINDTLVELLNVQLYLTEDSFELTDIEQTTVAFDYHACLSRQLDYEREPLPILISNTDKAEVRYTWFSEGVQHFHSLDIDLTFLNQENLQSSKDYLTATYIKEDSVHWLYYELFSGNQDIDRAFHSVDTVGEFYPRLYVRHNQKDIVDIPDTLIKKSVKRIYKKLGMNPKDLRDMLVNSVGRENWGDVRGLYIFNGVRINQANHSQAIYEYCFRYFKRLHTLFTDKPLTQAISDNTSTQTLKYTSLTHEQLTGQYKDLAPKTYLIEYEREYLGTSKRRRLLRRSKRTNHYRYHHYLIAQHEGYYERIHITDLSQYVSLSGYGANHLGFDENLVIPIDRSLIHELTKKEKERLYHQSLHTQLMFVRVTKGKWYERGAFKALLAVVAIALTFAFAPAGTSLMSLLRGMAVNVLRTLATQYAVNLLIDQAVKQGLIHPKYAGMISFIVTLSNMVYGVGFDLSKLTTAPNLMQLTNKAFNAYTQYLNHQITDVHKKQQELLLLKNNRQELLNQAQKLLDTKVFTPSQELLKSPFSPNIDLFETPELFYTRHSMTDVTELSFVSIYHYVDFVFEKSKSPKIYHTEEELDIILL